MDAKNLVISKESLRDLMNWRGSWKVKSDLLKGKWILRKTYTSQSVELIVDFNGKIQDISFFIGSDQIDSSDERLKDTQKKLATELRKTKRWEYSKISEECSIDIFPQVEEFLYKKYPCNYGNLKIIAIADEAGDNYGLTDRNSAYYNADSKTCFFLKKDNYLPWDHSLRVHEALHYYQHMKRWLLSPSETGLSGEDFQDLSVILERWDDDKSLSKISDRFNISEGLLRRISATSLKMTNYKDLYFEWATERHAFAEQFNYLKQVEGIKTERLVEVMGEMARGTPGWLKLKRIIENSEIESEKALEEMKKISSSF